MNTKHKVLELLEQNRGETISGAKLASLLNLSRNAVWKAIHSLKKDGYQIEAVSNRGYTLLKDNNILAVAGMLPYLANDDWAAKIKIYPSLESTNKTAKEMAINGDPHGTIIIADTQTAGKGRLGRFFHSPPGSGLYMSFILRPEALHFESPTTITAFAAISVCEAITAATQKTPMIKWVNDIFLDGVKIAGILTEAIIDLESKCLQWIVLGIGINFNTRSTDFPKELQQIAGSVYPDGSCPITRNELAATVINKLLHPHNHLTENELFKKYKDYLFILGKPISVILPQETFEATALDINPLGHLIVKKKNGDLLTLSSGEISIRPH